MTALKDSQSEENGAPTMCKRCNVAPATQQARQDPVCE